MSNIFKSDLIKVFGENRDFILFSLWFHFHTFFIFDWLSFRESERESESESESERESESESEFWFSDSSHLNWKPVV